MVGCDTSVRLMMINTVIHVNIIPTITSKIMMLRGARGGGEAVALTPVTPNLVDGGLLLLVGLVVLVFWSPIVSRLTVNWRLQW